MLLINYSKPFLHELLSMINSNYLEMRISSVVFLFNQTADLTGANGYPSYPKQITFTDYLDASELQQYMYPYGSGGRALMEHYFRENCAMAKPITSFIVAAVIVWGMVLMLHLVYTWCFQRANSLFI